MKFTLFYSLFMGISLVFGQEIPKNHLYIGMDLTKNIGHFANTSLGQLIIEPQARLVTTKKKVLIGVLGYAKKAKNDQFIPNTENYRCEGYYLKIGLAKQLLIIGKRMVAHLGGNFGFTMFNEQFDYRIDGDIFPDYLVKNDMRSYAFLAEPNVSFITYLWNRIGLDLNIRTSLIIPNKSSKGFEHAYVPGAGWSDASRVISAGASIALHYRIF